MPMLCADCCNARWCTVVGVAQGTRLYQFIGGPTFEALFANYDRNPAFLELPGDLVHSEISFFSKYQARTLSHNLFIYLLFIYILCVSSIFYK
jgi:hypothetical protein